MKLNNRGWGLGTFIGFICVFAIFIIVISINAYNIGLSKENISDVQFVDKSVYSNMEASMVDAAKEYVSNGKCVFSDGTCYITSKRLIDEKLISNLSDKSFNKCDGYVKATSIDSGFKAYIKCGSNYQTSGYVDEFAD